MAVGIKLYGGTGRKEWQISKVSKIMEKQNGKTPAESGVESRYLVMPHQVNPQGTVFGGVIMAWIDMVAAMAAQRHCGKEVVTASIDSLSFREPIYVGDHVVLKALVNYVGRTSMEVGVRVTREDPASNRSIIATTAHLTFVALDENKKPVPVGPIMPQSDDEKRRHQNAQVRVKARRELLAKIR